MADEIDSILPNGNSEDSNPGESDSQNQTQTEPGNSSTPDIITEEERASAVRLLFALVFEHIVPWGQPDGDTGLSSRLKLQRNFEKIKAWVDASPTYFLSRLYDDIAYGRSLGATAKFPRNAIWCKLADRCVKNAVD